MRVRVSSSVSAFRAFARASAALRTPRSDGHLLGASIPLSAGRRQRFAAFDRPPAARVTNMKVTSKLLECLHPDRTTCLLTGRSAKMVWELFKSLDIHGQGELNDIIFYRFMKHSTDLNRGQIYKIFDMLDFDGSGQIDFNEFYVIICILVAVKDNIEKQFIYCHSRTVFDFLNADGSSAVSVEEFANFGFLFNFRDDAIKDIFKEFDLSGDKELDYKEFKMFAMACIDRQNEIDRLAKEKAAKLKHDAITLEKKRVLLRMQKDGTLRSLIEAVEEKTGELLVIPPFLQINSD